MFSSDVPEPNRWLHQAQLSFSLLVGPKLAVNDMAMIGLSHRSVAYWISLVCFEALMSAVLLVFRLRIRIISAQIMIRYQPNSKLH